MSSGSAETRGAGPSVAAIDRALELLEALAECGSEGRALGELCAATGMSKATAYRALSTMRQRGFVTQCPSGDYRLGPQVLHLANCYRSGENLVRSLQPALAELSRQTQELVHLGAWDGSHVVYLDKVEPAARALRVWSSIGQRVPAASSALGRALLGAGGAPTSELEHAISLLPPARTVSLARLEGAVHEMRSTGFATETEENEPGVACLAVALLREGAPVAAISITSIAARMTPPFQSKLRQLIATVLPPLLPSGIRIYQPS